MTGVLRESGGAAGVYQPASYRPRIDAVSSARRGHRRGQISEVPSRMVKRARGSVRPGQRRPVARRPAAGAAAPARPAAPEAVRPTTLTDAEAARAAELEAAILAEERAAARGAQARRERTRERVDRSRPGGTLAAEEAIEYAYVERDIRRILVTAAVLLGVLIALWLVLEVGGLAPTG